MRLRLLLSCLSLLAGGITCFGLPAETVGAQVRTGGYLSAKESIRAAGSMPAATGSYARGTVALKAGDYRGAQAAFRQAIAQHDHAGAAWAGLGASSLALAQYKSAFTAYEHAFAAYPKEASLAYYAAYAAFFAGRTPDAITYATAAIVLRPRVVVSYHLRFLAYGRLVERKQQLSDAISEVKLAPHSADAFNDLGVGFSNNKRYKESITAFSRAIALRPGDWKPYRNRATAELASRRSVAALHDLQKALTLNPDPVNRKQIAQHLAKLRKMLHR